MINIALMIAPGEPGGGTPLKGALGLVARGADHQP
jgi:hypothetical protein